MAAMRPLLQLRQHGLEQRRAVAEAAIEAALGDAEVFGQHLDPHALDAGSCDFRKAGRDPGLVSRVSFGIAHGPVSPILDTVPYC